MTLAPYLWRAVSIVLATVVVALSTTIFMRDGEATRLAKQLVQYVEERDEQLSRLRHEKARMQEVTQQALLSQRSALDAELEDLRLANDSTHKTAVELRAKSQLAQAHASHQQELLLKQRATLDAELAALKAASKDNTQAIFSGMRRVHGAVPREDVGISDRCPSLFSDSWPPSEPFSDLVEASQEAGLIGDGLAATSCTPAGWNYLFTRSTAGEYPKGSIGHFFHREQHGGTNCPYLGWDAAYLSDAFLGRPSECGLVIDVGANIGLSMLPPASRGWRVLAFEPNPQNIARLKLNVALNGWGRERVAVVTAAVSDRNGSAVLFSPSTKHAAISALTARNVEYYKRARADEVHEHRTRLLRLDEYFAGSGSGLWPRVRVLKIDTQGHEVPVLRGMGRLLGAPPYPVILMEYEPPMQRGAGFDPSLVIKLLFNSGYRAFCPLAASTGRAAKAPSASREVQPTVLLPGGTNGSVGLDEDDAEIREAMARLAELRKRKKIAGLLASAARVINADVKQ